MDDFSADLEKSLEVIRSGGVILYPTDTVWGLGCDATNPEAVDRIFAIKQRPAAKSLIVLLADERDVLQYVAAPDLLVFDYLHTVKKPTTVIYDHAIGLADNVVNADGSIGIRLVDEPFCRHLVKRLRKPLVSTSANTSGQPTPRIFAEIADVVKDAVDYVVQYRRDDNRIAEPSAVIRWQNGQADVLRP
ncbi:MAG: threonylcarbamoyl-AMP synthase [Bacteroidetes bacterium]|nr:threonylcarbamoyl-AMP synthase [Bacteroidota bacterium]